MSLEDTTHDGRMWAALCYGSTFLGLPLGIIPLVQRNDAFALHHAKAALGMQLAFLAAYMAGFVLTFILFIPTFGLINFVMIPILMLMMVWPAVASIHGIILALNGDWTPAMGSFGIGDRLFASIGLETPKPPPS
jgi:hypothetical protein